MKFTKKQASSSVEVDSKRLADWRNAYEAPSSIVMMAGSLLLTIEAVLVNYYFTIPAALLLIVAVFRFKEAVSVWKKRILLAGCALEFISIAELSIYLKKRVLGQGSRPRFHFLYERWLMLKNADNNSVVFDALSYGPRLKSLWLGRGFLWSREDAQALYEIGEANYEHLKVNRYIRNFLNEHNTLSEQSVGYGAIHGVGFSREEDIVKPLSSLGGGTLIVGTTQAGKGVALTHLITQAIFRGEPVIIIDPKSSKRLRSSIRAACKSANRHAPLEFHPAFPQEGVRLDPIGAWTRPTEIASRIASVLPPDSGAFGNFAWLAVNTAVQGLFYITERPTLLGLREILETGIENTLKKALRLGLHDEQPENWEVDLSRIEPDDIKKYPQTDRDLAQLVALWEKYVESGKIKRSSQAANVIGPMIQVFKHNREHYAKITASLQPVLSQLTAGTLAKAISPDPLDPDDDRPIVTMEKVIEGNDVLYVGLDALPDSVVAGALGSILLADLAAYAGKRYNRGISGTQVERVALFVDETACVINPPMIELLNKGLEAGIHVTAAMQTVADLAARLGSDNKARMALGNFNNLIALRTKCRATQDFVCETFGKTTVWQTSAAVSSTAEGFIPQFRAGVTRSLSPRRDEIVPPEILGRLPNCEFFASVSGGQLWKGRLPILTETGTGD